LGKKKTLVFSQGLLRLLMHALELQLILFCGTAASFDAGTGGCEERPGGAYDSKDSSWVFRGGDTASLRVQREGDGKQESEAEINEGRSLH
jgi:hypothetical protein